MSYGMKVLNANQTVAYDSTSPGGVFLTFVTLPVGTDTSVQLYTLSSAYRAMNIILYPLSAGDHGYVAVNGNVESGQDPLIVWYNKRSVADPSTRKQTILMVFAK